MVVKNQNLCDCQFGLIQIFSSYKKSDASKIAKNKIYLQKTNHMRINMQVINPIWLLPLWSLGGCYI